MRDEKHILHPNYSDMKLNLRAVTSISLGLFFFLLFFQPLDLQVLEFNNKLLIQATYGGISFVLLGINRIAMPAIAPGLFEKENWSVTKEVIIDLLFVALNSVAFVFFSRFVASVPINFYVVIIITIISIVMVIIMVITNRYHFMRKELIRVNTRNKNNAIKTAPSGPRKITFDSENKSDFFQLLVQQIIVIRSANNYIEVFYKEDESVKTKLIRATLKKTENIFEPHQEIIRCHRSCLVNRNYIVKAEKSVDGLELTLNNYSKTIHVSRQYASKVKDSLKQILG